MFHPSSNTNRLHAASRIAQVQSPVIPQVRQLIEANPGTISLGQGVVHYPPPPAAFERLAQLGNAPLHRYGFVAGNQDLRKSIAAKLNQENGIDCDEEQVIFTAGSNMAFLHAILAIADVNDEVILPSPFFFNHEMAIQIAGCKAVCVPCRSDYQLDLEAIERSVTPRTRAIVTVSPNNPTGAMYPESDLRHVNQLCKEQELFHITDEAYEYFCFEDVHYSPASDPEAGLHTISMFTLSKAYGLAGWRAGYMSVPKCLIQPIYKIQDTSLVSSPPITEVVAQAALETGEGWCRRQIEPLKWVREKICHELSALPNCELSRPQGGFYMMLRIDTEMPAMKLVQRLIQEHSVAVLPGDTFGCTGTAIRIAYAALPADEIMEGIGRLKLGLQTILND